MVVSKTKVLEVKVSVLTLLLSVRHGNTLAFTGLRHHLKMTSCIPEREILKFFF